MTEVISALQFKVVEDWEKLPHGMHHDDVVGVAVDSSDRVFILTRRESRVVVFTPAGDYLDSWGEDLFTARTHGLTIAPDDTLFVADDGAHVVYHMTPTGEVLYTLGTAGVPSDSGYDGTLASIVRGAPPFNKPTNVAIAPNGDLYISDGYGNARVHRFSWEGEFLQSWGEPGGGPGQFQLPHGIAVLANGEVVVADRENDRLQFFTPDGEYLREWTDVQRPTNIVVDREGDLYVSELWRPTDSHSLRLGPTLSDHPGRVSVYDGSGQVIARWGGPERTLAGNFVSPHDICVDSRGDVYVAEVSHTHGVLRGGLRVPLHTLQKFRRV